MDRFDAMTTLLAVIEAGSLSAAGRKLGVPLSTVSRKIADLEAHLKTQLLVRSNRSITLTDAGRSYLVACRQIIDQLDQAERAAAGEYSAPRGELVVTAPILFGRLHVLPVVAAFLAAHSDISVRLLLSDRVVHLVDDHVDVALRIGHLPDSSLVAIKVGSTRHVICASPGYLEARGEPQTPQAVTDHACISSTPLSAPVWSFQVGGDKVAVVVKSRLHVSTSEAAIDAAIAGLGLTRALCYQIAGPRKAGRLKVILEQFEPEAYPISLVYAAQGMLPIKVRSFLDFATPRLRKFADT